MTGDLRIDSIVSPYDEKSGNNVTITVNTTNIGSDDYVKIDIYVNDNGSRNIANRIWWDCYAPTSPTACQILSANGTWSMSGVTFAMPNALTAVIDVYTYYWNGSSGIWADCTNSNHHRSSTIYLDGYLQIFNVETSPSTPNPGDTITVGISTYNTGGRDNVRILVRMNGNTLYDNSQMTDPYPVVWNITGITFTMPNGNAEIVVNSYNEDSDGGVWISNQEWRRTLVPGLPTCTVANITADKYFVNAGEVITFTLSRNPAGAGATANLMKKSPSGTYSSLSTCTTASDGKCTVTWTPGNSDIGTTYFRSEFNDCYSTDTYINVGSPGNFTVQDVTVTPTANTGDIITITASLRNDGDFSSSKFVYLKSDGINIDDTFVTVAAHSSSTTSWTRVAETSPGFGEGTHNICAETSVSGADTKCKSLIVTHTTPDLCSTIVCADGCYGNDLYTRVCDATGQCIQGTLKEANSLICQSTNYLWIKIKPHSWYNPAGAAQWMIDHTVSIAGTFANFFTGITDYQYLGLGYYTEGDYVYIKAFLKKISLGGLNLNDRLSDGKINYLQEPLTDAGISAGLIITLAVITTIGVGIIVAVGNSDIFEKHYTKKEVGEHDNNTLARFLINCYIEYSDPVNQAICAKVAVKSMGESGGKFFDDSTISKAGTNAAAKIDDCIAQYKAGQLDSAGLKSCTEGAVKDLQNAITDATAESEGVGSCWIKAPFSGTCLLSAKTGKKLVTAGFIVVGVYLGYKAYKMTR